MASRRVGTGPRNFPRTRADTARVRAGRPAVKAPARPKVSAAKASAGVSPPGGGGAGIPKATSPMASAPRNVTKAKSSKKGSMGLSPRADGPSKI